MSTPVTTMQPVAATCKGVSTSSRVFLFFAFIISLFVIGVTIANIIYFRKIANGNSSCAVSPGEGEAMFWVNVIILVMAIILFIWSLIGMFLKPKHIAYLTGQFGETS